MTNLPRLPVFRREDEDRGPWSGPWLITFTDLVCLMLTFFVMSYAMREPETERWQALTKALSARSTATAPSERTPEPRSPFNAATVEPHSAINLDYLAVLLRSQFAGNPELAGLAVEHAGDRVVIGLPGDVLFDPGGAAFTDRGRRVLFLLGAVVGRIGNRIEIVGHAERSAAPDDPDGVGWEVALARATVVAATLRETGYRRELVARAVMERAPAGGASHARRVDIVVREMEG